MDNMQLYNRFRNVPVEAKKEIKAGKLKGFTDVNPMWRLKSLTEAFGPCGFGWYIEDEIHWTEQHGGEVAAFCKVLLKVKHPDTGEWSVPIIGIGGSKLVGKGVGDGINDEAYKMAYTDAISIACKNLGMAADVYFDKDRTKYNSYVEAQPAQAPASKSAASVQKKRILVGGKAWNSAVEKHAKGEDMTEAMEERYSIIDAEWDMFFEAVNNYKRENNIQ
jgi:hypothetical protein